MHTDVPNVKVLIDNDKYPRNKQNKEEDRGGVGGGQGSRQSHSSNQTLSTTIPHT